jgi:EAL domain-containing protein (putative c-di-GMP-specific phosphodiesterase class I)/GGDEF domain-containing protein
MAEPGNDMLTSVKTIKDRPMLAGRSVDPLLDAVRREVHFTYQPIVSAYSGLCFGYEAQPQGQGGLGFATVSALYDHAHLAGGASSSILTLREKVARDFSAFSVRGERLLLSLDHIMQLSLGDISEQTVDIFSHFGLNPTALCIAVSENLLSVEIGREGRAVKSVIDGYRRQSCLFILDRFGSGTAGLKAIYEYQPNVIRIDRYFIVGISDNERKKLFVSTVVNLAHVLGIVVIADGVNCEKDFLACKQIGCDLVQGDFVSQPMDISEIFNRSYSVVADASRRERRERRGDQKLLRDELSLVVPLSVGDPMSTVFQAFRAEKNHDFLPIVDDRSQPVGIIREFDLKDVIYSRYGKDLLHNKALYRGLLDFIRPCPVCDINTEAEKILETFSQASNPPGILLVDEFKYVGVLSAASLLRVINEKNLALARDQNPLTRLPGNSCIADHLVSALESVDSCWTFVYFDLDNFKPFNDRYGFRQGDRAILLFSDLMRSHLSANQIFLGHIGGDDFFASFRDLPPNDVSDRVETLLATFRRDVESFHDADSRQRGYIVGRNRDGVTQHFPLLTCSAALVEIPAGARTVTVDDLGDAIAILKKGAKQAPRHMAAKRLG